MPLNDYIFPNDISEYSVKLEGSDITGIVDQSDIYQDILSPIWSAIINVTDANNLHSTLPIIIGMKVEITVETQAKKPCAESKTYEFYIYKIGEKKFIKENTYKYKLFLITKEFFINQKTRVSKYFEKMTPAKMVSKIVKEAGLGTVETDKDPIKYTLIIPNWSPFNAIEWITRFAKKPDNGPDFVFFQSDMEKFVFKSTEELFNTDSGIKFKQLITQERDKQSGNIVEDSYLNIEQYKFSKNVNAIEHFTRGVFNNTVLYHDIINKKYSKTKYNYSEDISEDKSYKPFKGELFEDSHDSSISISPIHSGNYEFLNTNETQKDWLGSRKANMMKFEMNKLLIDIPGHTCLYRLLGQSVEVELPLHDFKSDSGELDKYYKGKYLVTAIRHSIINKHYKIVLELNKKRLETAI
jgi:hypothetical protein